TDREYRARQIPARPGAGSEFGYQRSDHLPLLGAGVLALIDQHVINAEVELVMHPGGRLVGEQVAGLVDQVVVVEEAAAILLGPVTLQHGGGDGEHRSGSVTTGERLATLGERDQSVTLGVNEVAELVALVERFGERADARRKLLGQE